MTDKLHPSQHALKLQMEVAQQLVLTIQAEHGTDKALEMINAMMEEMTPEQATLLRNLITVMQAEAMGDAGNNIH